jgi:protoheme IX farnesyltransferase
MPVVKGPKSTRRQIFAYSLLLAPLGVAPVFTGLGGPLYAVVSILGGVAFVALAFRMLFSQAGEPEQSAAAPRTGKREGLYTVSGGSKAARDLFAVSLFYLFALFAALLVEHSPLATLLPGLRL